MGKKTGLLAFMLLTANQLCTSADQANNTDTASAEKDQEKPTNFDEAIFNWTRTFAETLQLTNQKHYKITSPEQCMIKAISSFLDCLDPHSSFLDPKTYKSILETTSGEFFGIGIVIDNTRQTKDKFLTVVDTIQKGPADNAGVKPFDKIVEIEGTSLEGMSTEEATAKLKGERNTKVHIKVLRENYPDVLSFDIIRDVVKEQHSHSFYIEDQNIYYISLTQFSENSIKPLETLLKKASKNDYKGLILDLRNNSGGLLTSAIDIAGLFLEKDSLVVVTKDKFNKETARYATTRKPIASGALPIFILINNYTASAAEILAGVLKIHSEKLSQEAGSGQQKNLMVFLVGTKSFGKGSVQEVIPISNNCAVKLTTSLYYLPNNITIQGIGIEPDVTIEKRLPPTEQMTWFTKFYGREQALSNYIKTDLSKEKEAADKKATEKEKTKKDDKEKNWIDRARDMLSSDNQFRDTLTLINILSNIQAIKPELVNTRDKAVAYLKKNYVSSDQKLSLVEVKV